METSPTNTSTRSSTRQTRRCSAAGAWTARSIAAGGPEILAATRRLRATSLPDGLPTGRAVATTAGRLPARWVIHTVGPVYSTSEDRSGAAAVGLFGQPGRRRRGRRRDRCIPTDLGRGVRLAAAGRASAGDRNPADDPDRRAQQHARAVRDALLDLARQVAAETPTAPILASRQRSAVRDGSAPRGGQSSTPRAIECARSAPPARRRSAEPGPPPGPPPPASRSPRRERLSPPRRPGRCRQPAGCTGSSSPAPARPDPGRHRICATDAAAR